MNVFDIMQQVTQRLIDKGETPYSINNGLCVDWAEEVFSVAHDSDHEVELWETLFGFSDTTHAFLRVDGKFYDAEALDGVSDHMNLPIFSGLDRQPVWCIDSNHTVDENKRDMSNEMVEEYYRIN
jgi:hypothetical protein